MESALARFLSELQHQARQGAHVFRGEREAEGLDGRKLPVTSSLYRQVQTRLRHPDGPVPGRLDSAPLTPAETRRLQDLQDRIAAEVNRLLPEPYPKADKLKLLARVQHFGGPTNLIDFTRDCLVALYFACYDRQGEENGGGWTGGDGRIVFLSADDTRIVEASIRDTRAIAQRSVFCAEASGFLPADTYESLCVPADLKQPLRMYLAQCHGICTDTMFPDFAGAVRHVSSHATLDALWDEVSRMNASS